MNLRHLLLGCLALVASSISAQEPSSETVVRAVDLSKGVSRAEAVAIAEVYYSRNITSCGSAEVPVDRGTRWEVTPIVGTTAQPSPDPIVIDKRTGRVSWKGGPTFRNLHELLASGP